MDKERCKRELVRLELATRVYKDTDGYNSIGIRTNDQAADIVMEWLRTSVYMSEHEHEFQDRCWCGLSYLDWFKGKE